MPALEKVARNTLVQAGGHGFGLLVSVATTTIVARYLDVGSFGAYSLLAVVFALLAGVSSGSLESVAVRELAGRAEPEQGMLERLIGLRLALSVALALVVVGGSFVLPLSTDLRLAVLVLAAVSVAGSLQGTLVTVFQARLQFAVPAAVDAATRIVLLAGYVLVLLVLVPDGPPRVAAAVAPLLLGTLAGVALTWRLLRRRGIRLGIAFDRRGWGRLAAEMAPLAALQVLGVVNYRLDIVALGVLSGAEAAGIYGIAFRFIDAALPLAAFFAAALFPLLARDAAGSAVRAQRALGTVVVAAPFVVLPLVVLAPRLVTLVGGSDYGAAALPLRILALSLPFSAVAMLLVSLLVAHRRERALLPLVVFSIALNLGLNLALIPGYGVAGSATATLVAEAVGCVLLFRLVRRTLGISLSLRPLLAPATALFGRTA